MNFRGPLAAALAAVLLAAAPRSGPTLYASPAGDRPAGASRLEPVDAVLPNGKTAAPLHRAVFVGAQPLGVALTPNGRYAVVAGAAALSVVETASLRVVSQYGAASAAFSGGVSVLRDPADPTATLVLACDGSHDAVRVFSLGADGSLTAQQPIAVPGFPARIAVSSDGRMAYVSSSAANTVTALDLAARRVLHRATVGFSPLGLAVAGGGLYVADAGLQQYRSLAQPAAAPGFAPVPGDPYRSSALSMVALSVSGDLATSDASASAVRLDQVPDGVENVGGAQPSAVVARRDGRFAYVSLSNVDRISTVALGADPHVVGGLDIRLFVNAPYGTQPDAEALAPDGSRLYVALAGLNAVAVLDTADPAQLHRLGLIPTGSLPSALAISPDGRYLFVTAAAGVDGNGLLQRVDLRSLNKAQLVKATLSALRYNRSVSTERGSSTVPALRSDQRSSVIDRIVYISVGSTTFDATFGDIGSADANPSFVQYGESVTPNLHALARQYGLASNFYLESQDAAINAQYAMAGTVALPELRGPTSDDPENYPRAGYLFNALERSRQSYRDYGALLQLSGYQPYASRPRGALGLGGTYALDVPALAALSGRVDLQFPGVSPVATSAGRADEFVRDMGALVQSDQQPAFTAISLPASGATGMAEADRAVGKIVAFLSRTPHWSSTAVIIVPNTTAGSNDHVNRARAFALVVSPLAKPHYDGRHHLSLGSVVKTEEELLGLPPLSLGDLLATDMADFFGAVPYPNAYNALN